MNVYPAVGGRIDIGFWAAPWGLRGPDVDVTALLGVTGRPKSSIGRIFRGPGVVVMVLDACVAADAVASRPNIC